MQVFHFLMAFICSAVIVNKNRKPQSSQVFLELELVLLSSSRNCGMRAAQFHHLSHTYQLGQSFRFQFFQESCETSDNESNASPNFFHR